MGCLPATQRLVVSESLLCAGLAREHLISGIAEGELSDLMYCTLLSPSKCPRSSSPHTHAEYAPMFMEVLLTPTGPYMRCQAKLAR